MAQLKISSQAWGKDYRVRDLQTIEATGGLYVPVDGDGMTVSGKARLDSLSSAIGSAGSTLPAGWAGTGSVSRSMTAVLSDGANVKNFGVVMDGSTDDTAALTAMNANFSVLAFPPGLCVLDKFEPLADTIMVLHPGATLKLKSAATGSLIRLATSGFRLYGGTLDGNLAGQVSLRDCIQIVAGGNGALINGAILTGAKRAGINADGTSTPIDGLTLDNVKISDCAQYGLYAEGVLELLGERLKVYDIGTNTLHHAITLKTCTDAQIDVPRVYRPTGIGIEISGGANNRVTNCYVKDASNIATSIAGNSSHNGFDGGLVDSSAVTSAYLTEISCVSGINYGCYYKNMVLLGANNAGGGNTTDRAASWSHASSSTNQDCEFSNNYMRDCTRNLSISSGTRRAVLRQNTSINATSYHFEMGGNDNAVCDNKMTGGTKCVVLNGTNGAFIDGNKANTITENGIFEATASTLTQIGVNYWGVTDKINGVPGSLWVCTDGDVPNEVHAGYGQLYLNLASKQILIRGPDGVITTWTGV